MTFFIDWMLSELKPRFKQPNAVRSSNILDDFENSGNNDFDESSATAPGPVRKVSNVAGVAVGGNMIKKAMQDANANGL